MSCSSPIATARVESPTGPPPNLAAIVASRLRSLRSRPASSTSNMSSAAIGDLRVNAALSPDLGEVAHPPQQPVRDPRSPARALGDRRRALGVDLDLEDRGGADDDLGQVLGAVVLEAMTDAEAIPQRGGQEPAPGGRADQGEGGQRQGHGAGAGALAEDDGQAGVLHRRVEGLLDGAAKAVDLVDEEDASGLQRGEEGGDVGLALERRAGGLHHRHPELGGDDEREGGLAEARRPGEQDVVEGLVAPAGGLDEEPELLGHLPLVDELGQPRRPQRAVEVLVGAIGARVGTRTRRPAAVGIGPRLDPRGTDPRAVADLRRLAHAALDFDSPARRRAAAISSSGSSPSSAASSSLGLERRVAEVDEAVAGERAGARFRLRRSTSPPPPSPPLPSPAARR